MRVKKLVALAVALVFAVALGVAFTPVAHGQIVVARQRTAPRALEVLSGRGSTIGVSIRDLDQADAKGDKNAAPSGVVIEEVTPDSPAEKAGIKKGDAVVEFDGERVRSVRQFTRLVQETPAGRQVHAIVLRNGQKTTVTLEPRQGDGFSLLRNFDGLGVLQDFGRNFSTPPPAPPVPPARPARPTPPTPPSVPDIQSFVWRSGNAIGITVGDLPPQLAEYFGAKEGVLVTSVSADSAAARAGLKAGDVITSVNGATVDDPADVRGRIQRLGTGEAFTIGVVRDKKAMTLKGTIEPPRDRRRT